MIMEGALLKLALGSASVSAEQGGASGGADQHLAFGATAITCDCAAAGA
jgi:hypothetical protein